MNRRGRLALLLDDVRAELAVQIAAGSGRACDFAAMIARASELGERGLNAVGVDERTGFASDAPERPCD